MCLDIALWLWSLSQYISQEATSFRNYCFVCLFGICEYLVNVACIHITLIIFEWPQMCLKIDKLYCQTEFNSNSEWLEWSVGRTKQKNVHKFVHITSFDNIQGRTWWKHIVRLLSLAITAPLFQCCVLLQARSLTLFTQIGKILSTPLRLSNVDLLDLLEIFFHFGKIACGSNCLLFELDIHFFWFFCLLLLFRNCIWMPDNTKTATFCWEHQ